MTKFLLLLMVSRGFPDCDSRLLIKEREEVCAPHFCDCGLCLKATEYLKLAARNSFSPVYPVSTKSYVYDTFQEAFGAGTSMLKYTVLTWV